MKEILLKEITSLLKEKDFTLKSNNYYTINLNLKKIQNKEYYYFLRNIHYNKNNNSYILTYSFKNQTHLTNDYITLKNKNITKYIKHISLLDLQFIKIFIS
jgi:hypothetical protein